MMSDQRRRKSKRTMKRTGESAREKVNGTPVKDINHQSKQIFMHVHCTSLCTDPCSTFTRPGDKVSQSYYVPQSRPPVRTGLLGPPPPPSVAGLPLQNTVIVQHQSGQSVYVQQQIFPTPSNFPQGMLATQYAPVHFPPPTLPVRIICTIIIHMYMLLCFSQYYSYLLLSWILPLCQ